MKADLQLCRVVFHYVMAAAGGSRRGELGGIGGSGTQRKRKITQRMAQRRLLALSGRRGSWQLVSAMAGCGVHASQPLAAGSQLYAGVASRRHYLICVAAARRCHQRLCGVWRLAAA
jgi:hypothetical protein